MEFQHSTLKSDKEFILPAVKNKMTDYQPPVKKSQNDRTQATLQAF